MYKISDKSILIKTYKDDKHHKGSVLECTKVGSMFITLENIIDKQSWGDWHINSLYFDTRNDWQVAPLSPALKLLFEF